MTQSISSHDISLGSKIRGAVMPFCPNCRYEYNPEIFKCPDCEVYLVSRLPEKTEIKHEERKFKGWIELAILTSDTDAEMLSEVLNSKDIPNQILSASGYFAVTGQMGPSSFQPAGGGFIVLVPSEFVEQVDTEGAGIFGEKWEKSKLVDLE